MNDVRITADDFLKASRALRNAGEKELRKNLHRRMRVAAKPLVGRTRDVAKRTLPQEGGLAKKVARAPQRVQVRTRSKAEAGVRIVVGKRRGSGAAGANRGVIRHPVFDTGKWVEQRVSPGWFDDTLRRDAPKVRPDVEAAIRDTLEWITREVT